MPLSSSEGIHSKRIHSPSSIRCYSLLPFPSAAALVAVECHGVNLGVTLSRLSWTRAKGLQRHVCQRNKNVALYFCLPMKQCTAVSPWIGCSLCYVTEAMRLIHLRLQLSDITLHAASNLPLAQHLYFHLPVFDATSISSSAGKNATTRWIWPVWRNRHAQLRSIKERRRKKQPAN